MTHSPPIPPGNQSPYPVVETPHADHPPGTRETISPRQKPDTLSPSLVIGAVLAAAGLVVAAAALARRRGRPAPVAAVPTRKMPAAGTVKGPTGRTRPKAGKATAKAPTPRARPKRTTRTKSDDKNDRGPQDASRIAMGEDYEVLYWTKKFGVDRDALQRAVDAVGNGSAAVQRELGKS